jgi:hypothetical protein
MVELTERELLEHPIWVDCHITDDEEWYDELDECAIRPCTERTFRDVGQYFLLATFENERRVRRNGYVYVSTAGMRAAAEHPSLKYFPTVVCGKSRVELWCGAVYEFGTEYAAAGLQTLCDLFGCEDHSPFPLTVDVRTRAFGGIDVQFVVDGFYGFIDDNKKIGRVL